MKNLTYGIFTLLMLVSSASEAATLLFQDEEGKRVDDVTILLFSGFAYDSRKLPADLTSIKQRIRDGKWKVNQKILDTNLLVVDADGFALEIRPYWKFNGTNDVVFTLHRAPDICNRLVLADGSFASGVKVGIRSFGAWGYVQIPRIEGIPGIDATTDEGGNFCFRHIRYMGHSHGLGMLITASTRIDGRLHTAAKVLTPTHGTQDKESQKSDLKLAAAIDLRGRVVDYQTGDPIAGAQMSRYGEWDQKVKLDEEGRFHIIEVKTHNGVELEVEALAYPTTSLFLPRGHEALVDSSNLVFRLRRQVEPTEIVLRDPVDRRSVNRWIGLQRFHCEPDPGALGWECRSADCGIRKTDGNGNQIGYHFLEGNGQLELYVGGWCNRKPYVDRVHLNPQPGNRKIEVKLERRPGILFRSHIKREPEIEGFWQRVSLKVSVGGKALHFNYLPYNKHNGQEWFIPAGAWGGEVEVSVIFIPERGPNQVLFEKKRFTAKKEMDWPVVIELQMPDSD